MKRKNKKRKIKYGRVLILFLLLNTALAAGFIGVSSLMKSLNWEYYKHSGPLESVTPTSTPLDSDGLYSPNVLLLQRDDDTVLLEKNSDRKIYPASLTKIMTVILAIEKTEDLDHQVLLSADMFDRLYAQDASMAGFLPDEKVTAKDLLYGAMLPSGAECCMGLANDLAGSEKNFVDLMNKKAKDLGMADTHFSNTTGLHDNNHTTTVKDLACLLDYALDNELFRDIFTSSKHSTLPTDRHPDGITFYNTMFEKLETPLLEGGKILGGKTGYTKEAGLCLASLAIKDSKEYILVTAGAQGNHETEPYHIKDAFAAYRKLD